MSVPKEHIIEKYEQIVKSRENLWTDLKQIPSGKDWLTKRLSPHQWAIDEVLRHMFASEVRYVQQPLDPSITQRNDVVLAQWVGKIFFRFEENDHLKLEDLMTAFDEIQTTTRKMISEWTDATLDTLVEAPWKEMYPYRDSVIHFLEHEISHMGQVQFILTYFRGPPDFESDWSMSNG